MFKKKVIKKATQRVRGDSEEDYSLSVSHSANSANLEPADSR